MPTFSTAADPADPADPAVLETNKPVKKPGNRRKNAPAPAPEPEPAPEPDSPISEPTFPNMVILKQTEHNYIVKHNHYPLVGASSVGLTSANDNISTDLVSPNQIHKGQINKKRGRKPKAGLILNSKGGLYDTTEVPNIILHLKCHVSDLKTNDSISSYEYTPAISEVESYMAQSTYLQPSDISRQKNNDVQDEYESDDSFEMNDTTHDSLSSLPMNIENNVVNNEPPTHPVMDDAKTTFALNGPEKPATKPKKLNTVTDASIQVMNDRNHKEIMKKIHRLKYSFHNGESIQTKMNHRPACFWDACEFDGPIYYIPIMIVNGVFQVSGCYCSPQCAVASLLKEPLDTSTKFERLHLLHLLYGAPNSKGFKPAPNPHYLLDKFYGNLTIQEYRTLLKGPQMIHIVNKPLTHILPELYEDNNDFLVNSKVIPANTLKMKKKYKTMVVQSGAE
jgi:hypothetical protein